MIFAAFAWVMFGFQEFSFPFGFVGKANVYMWDFCIMLIWPGLLWGAAAWLMKFGDKKKEKDQSA